METNRIVIGREPNTEQSIYLMASGEIVCGGYTYQGRKSKNYRGLFETIWEMVDCSKIKEVLDISKYRYWNALNIYDEHIVRTWDETIDAETLHDLSIETQIHLMMQPVKKEFLRALSLAWRRALKKSDSDDPDRPTQAWHLCRLKRN